MKFKKLRELILKEFKNRLKEKEKAIKTKEGLKKVVEYTLNKKEQYKGTLEEQQKKTLIAVQRKLNKQCLDKLDFIKSIEEADTLKNPLIITLEWTKSRMWGSNPRAYTNYGFEGESIGGCGYCKTSTATGQALNNFKPILKLLYAKKEKWFKDNPNKKFTEDIKREYLGYGSGYSILPIFEGGVGVSSHENIIKGLGLKWECIVNTKNTNVFRIAK